MKRKMDVWYDREGDFIEILFKPSSGLVRSIGNECFELLDKKENVVGYAIFNFSKRFKEHKHVELPIKIE